ncbi:MAG TPA: DUF6356 family protein [Hypericibacter adhaerens]|jgi:hypothetical protein|uniref:Capsule biosynthesis protein n=1 Tax=Hypericibacter adhaerens TaxID=2602016 RepID=A0A5J6N5K0_9PROT|nr:DUF6356 family protein [Hypericibacter adhaerens]QEX22216.1 hypothetical protein FRZ61_21460 [Hypericibacter adhaerens]HWA43961.1 DUF6356 family protein [Hypericibacter adhaerens]
MSWHKPFTEHPASVGESYGEHWLAAMGFGLRMFGASLACMVHAFLPSLFTRTGSRAIERLHDRMVVNRRRGGAQPIGALPNKAAR